MANKIQRRSLRRGFDFSHRALINLLRSGKISLISRFPGLGGERLETLRLCRFKSWIERKPKSFSQSSISESHFLRYVLISTLRISTVLCASAVYYLRLSEPRKRGGRRVSQSLGPLPSFQNLDAHLVAIYIACVSTAPRSVFLHKNIIRKCVSSETYKTSVKPCSVSRVQPTPT